MSKLLSQAEKTYVLHGIEENFRIDGRERHHYRPMELETDILPQTNGSARLRLANTDILVGIKTEIDAPYPDKPDEGKLEFFVDCSANATPEFEGRGGENLGMEIANGLSTAYNSSRAFNLNCLCIVPERTCWKVNVDILILECGGNLFDAASLAVKAALFDTKLPSIKAAELDGEEVDLFLAEDIYEHRKFDITNVPTMITLCKIGEHCVVDLSAAEEQCCVGSLVLALSGDRVVSVLKQGSGSFHPSTLIESLTLGTQIAVELNTVLCQALDRERKQIDKEHVGFLR